MAVRGASVSNQTNKRLSVSWSGLANGDVGAGISAVGYNLISVNFQGTAGTGFGVTMEISLDGGSTWIAPAGWSAGASITALPGIQASGPAFAPLIRPHVTGGDGTTNVNVFLEAGAAPG